MPDHLYPATEAPIIDGDSVNTYVLSFRSPCPSNGAPIDYRLTIDSESMLLVEDVMGLVSGVSGYHEKIADDLFARLGGKQTMVANHHGVTVVTTRGF